MPPAVSLAVLALSTAALLGAGVRLASLAAPSGPERAIAAVVLAAGTAAVETLALGLVDLGASPVALGLAAGLTWLATRLLVPAPELAVGRELGRTFARIGAKRRIGLAAAFGIGVAWTAWLIRYPVLQLDGIGYHLTEVGAWIHGGTPGADTRVMYEIPTSNYPLTNEVLLTWQIGIARSFLPVAAYMPALFGLAVLAGWRGLSALGVRSRIALVATLCVLLTPSAVAQLPGPNTDLPATAWLLCCGALCACVRGRPALLAPALVAAGLAAGTKTTTMPLTVVAMGIAAWSVRGQLRPLLRPLLGAAVVAGIVGATWYVRNLVDHGWPFWPFQAGPVGDAVPPFLKQLEPTFLDRPRFTLEGRVDDYLRLLGGGAVLLAAPVVASLLKPRKEVLAASAVTLGMLLLWASSPVTGRAADPLGDLALAAVRYMLPLLCAAALALALAARGDGWRPRVARGLLWFALAWNVLAVLAQGFPDRPGTGTIAAGAAVGAVLALLPLLRRERLWPAGAAAAAVLVAVAVALSPSVERFPERHAEVGLWTRPIVAWFASQPDWREGDATVSMAPLLASPLAGPRFEHDVQLIPQQESCAGVRRRAAKGWVVLFSYPFPELQPKMSAPACLANTPPVFYDGYFAVWHGLGARKPPPHRQAPRRGAPKPAFPGQQAD